jgi:hypothetical protein
MSFPCDRCLIGITNRAPHHLRRKASITRGLHLDVLPMAKPTVEAGWTPGRDVPQSIAQPTSNEVLILSHFVTMSKTIEAQTLHLA